MGQVSEATEDPFEGEGEVSVHLQRARDVLTMPLALPGQLQALVPSTALTASNWRQSAALRETHWCCHNCSELVLKPIPKCHSCGAAHNSDMALSTPAAVPVVGCDTVQKSTVYMRFTATFLALPHLVGLGQWYCTGKSAFGPKM